MSPILSVKEDIDRSVAPDQMLLPTLAKGTVEPTFGDPFVDGLLADLCQGCELSDVEDGREMRTGTVAERLADFRLREFSPVGTHRLNTRSRNETEGHMRRTEPQSITRLSRASQPRG